jgi:hypothetical protein
LRLRDEDVFDLSYETADEMELEPQQLIADDYGPCQEFADRCRSDSRMPQMLRVPSAALPGTKNLVVFGPRVAAPYLVDPLGPVDVPLSMVSDGAVPPAAIFPLVRFLGAPHAEYEAWARGDPFDFAEPAFPLP